MEQKYQERVTGYTDNATHSPGLSSSEIGNLWNEYVDGSTAMCLLKSFLKTVEDKDIGSLLDETLEVLNQRSQMITDIFRKENLPIPLGFSDTGDVDLNAPRLYTDYFYLYYLKCINKFEIPLGSLNFVTSTRSDVLDYYDFRSSTSTMLQKKVTNALLTKGIDIRPPYVTTSRNIDMVKKQTFLTGFLGEKRPLLAQEVSSLFHAILSNYVGKYLLTGFRQTARSRKVRNYMDRGIDLTSKMIDSFGSILNEEDILVPAFWDTMVTDSTVPPFSDQLMMFKTTLLNRCGILGFSYVMINSYRHDIKAQLLKVMPSAADYAEDGLNIMIKNGWFEEPPRTVDRRELVNVPKH
ncbi:MAG: DUF3231 family protein [Syntrophomonas sp.]